YFLADTHYNNTSLISPISLSPLSGWFKENTSITGMDYFLADTHYNNTSLISPISLSPLSGWFKENTSIMGMDYFLADTHYNNTSLTSPISLIPLKDWFDADRSITTLQSFLNETHYNNTSLDLVGQKIFPNWIQTLKEDIIDIENVTDAFYRMFYCDGNKTSGDTGEPTFEDGTPLSDIGTPSDNKETYTNRTSLPNYDNPSPLNGWK
ncbi:MAG: hypothetical protein LBS25_06815, partial [Candidatus Symbiothrix sp.]|nr:hypothetical protein [Candidatus Symbiothrix sp.]